MKHIAWALAGAALIAAPALAQAGSAPSAQAGAAAKPNVTVGASVNDTSGAPVGTIASVTGTNAIVSTGAAKASIPLASFGQGANGGLVLGMTKADLEAAVNKASKPTDITVGATVSDQNGAKVGTVSAVAGDLVTVATATSKAQLPKTAFAQGPNGLVIGMTASQLDAAAKAAGGGTGASPGGGGA